MVRKLSFLVAILLIASFGKLRAESCRAIPSPGVPADQTGWCWAAAIKWCTDVYGTPEVQCQIAYYFCYNFHTGGGGCGPPPDYCCNVSMPCAGQAYPASTIRVGMNDMGFDIDWYSRALTESELDQEVCTNKYLVMAFLDNGETAHVVVIFGFEPANPSTGTEAKVYYMDSNLADGTDLTYS